MMYYLIDKDGRFVGKLVDDLDDDQDEKIRAATVLEFEGILYLYDHLLQEGHTSFFREIGKPLSLFESEIEKETGR